MEQGHRYSCVMEGLIIGVSMGAIAGYLFAPRAEKLLEKTGELYSSAHDKTNQVFGRAAESAEEKLNRVKEALGRA